MQKLFDPTKRPVQLAVGLAAAGFVLIVLGWNGSANLDHTQGQIPYLISGGVAGLALVLVGLTLLIVSELKRATSEVLAGLDRVRDDAHAGTGPTAVPDGGPLVVAGRATYHLTTCRLVASRTDLQTMSPSAAIDRGLAGCRICGAGDAVSA